MFLWYVTELAWQKFQLLITLGENGLRTERWEGGERLEFIFLSGFICRFHSFFPLWGKQVSHFRAKLFKCFYFYLCEELNDILNVDDAGQWFPIRCDFTPPWTGDDIWTHSWLHSCCGAMGNWWMKAINNVKHPTVNRTGLMLPSSCHIKELPWSWN